jgi:hypothetical protein
LVRQGEYHGTQFFGADKQALRAGFLHDLMADYRQRQWLRIRTYHQLSKLDTRLIENRISWVSDHPSG